MKQYCFSIILGILGLIVLAACSPSKGETKIPTEATITTEPIVSEDITPILEEKQENDSKGQEHSEEMFFTSPTPGPESYSVFELEKEMNVGDIVSMGAYTHTKNINVIEKMPIKWLVLERNENKALLITLYNIDTSAYYMGKIEGYGKFGAGCTWETCEIREWLNGKFMEYAFLTTEKECIVSTQVHTSDNPVYGTSGGENTTDYLFLLSLEEAQRFFASENERRTQIVPDVSIMDSVIYPGAVPDTTDYYDWWLRSPGETEEQAVCVGKYGEIIQEGEWVFNEQVSVRPAMWIDLEKVKEIGLELFLSW